MYVSVRQARQRRSKISNIKIQRVKLKSFLST